MDDDSIHLLMNQVTRLYYMSNFKYFHKLGIHPRQGPIFKVLRDVPNISGKQLAEALHVSPPTVAVSLQRLEKGGYVKRDSDPFDRRAYMISLTEAGRDLDDTFREQFDVTSQAALKDFTEEETQSMVNYLIRMRANLLALDPEMESELNHNHWGKREKD